MVGLKGTELATNFGEVGSIWEWYAKERLVMFSNLYCKHNIFINNTTESAKKFFWSKLKFMLINRSRKKDIQNLFFSR